MTEESKKRVIVYVDGFNFYYGIRTFHWKSFYWLDIVKFFNSFLKGNEELVTVKYFSAVPMDSFKAQNQSVLFQANKLNPKFELILGKYKPKNITCPHCSSIINSFEEKKTDVNISIGMVNDVVENNCDITVLVSGDSDLLPPLELIKKINPSHKIYIFYPPCRRNYAFYSIANVTKNLEKAHAIFMKSMLPDSIKISGEIELKRPANWITSPKVPKS